MPTGYSLLNALMPRENSMLNPVAQRRRLRH
jgi:hypothetical protein